MVELEKLVASVKNLNPQYQRAYTTLFRPKHEWFAKDLGILLRSYMRLNVFLTFGLVVIMFFSGCRYHRTEKLQDERLDDFRKLFMAYNEKPTATNIDELIQILAAHGKKLDNPYRKDPTKPCYRLMIVSNSQPDAILIEETNTTLNLMHVLWRDGTGGDLPKH